MKKAIAWYKICIIRTRGYINIYMAGAMTVLLFKSMDLPMALLPVFLIGALVMVWVIGTLDIKLGIFKEENRIVHENSPYIVDILNKVKE